MWCGQMSATMQQRGLQFLVHGPCRAHDAARHPCNALSLHTLARLSRRMASRLAPTKRRRRRTLWCTRTWGLRHRSEQGWLAQVKPEQGWLVWRLCGCGRRAGRQSHASHASKRPTPRPARLQGPLPARLATALPVGPAGDLWLHVGGRGEASTAVMNGCMLYR